MDFTIDNTDFEISINENVDKNGVVTSRSFEIISSNSEEFFNKYSLPQGSELIKNNAIKEIRKKIPMAVILANSTEWGDSIIKISGNLQIR